MKRLFFLLTLFFCTPAIADTTVTFQQGTSGYSGEQDNWLVDGGSTSVNNGGNAGFLIGYESGFAHTRGVMRWDLSTISGSETIVSANLQLWDEEYASRTANCAINIYEIKAANSSWVVGTADFATQGGSSCWADRQQGIAGWAGGSTGCGVAGTDYVNTSLASYTFVDGAGAGYKTITFNASGLTYLQSLFGTSGGTGFVVIGEEVTSNSLTKTTSAEGTAAHRPILTITYASGGTRRAGMVT